MGKQVCLLMRLEGPLQAWGARSRWDVRDSADEPTKSGLIGMLGCALGYPRGDRRLEDLDLQLSFGVRVEHPGTQILDFHTVSGSILMAAGGYRGSDDDPSTIISPRTYLQDAAFLAVFSGPEDVLTECAAALQSPRWPIYLGRKCCIPTRPVYECLTYEYESVRDALEQRPWRWDGIASDSKNGPPERLRCTIDDPNGSFVRDDLIRVNPARMYGRRSVYMFWTKFPGVEEGCGCISPA